MLEIKQVLRRFIEKNIISEKEGEALLRRIKKDSELTITSSQINLSRDKNDNKLLICAKDGDADYLVTGDKKHLLTLKKIGKTKIISAKTFTDLLG